MRIIKDKENKGFTLVEIIVSMLVLSITIVSVLSAFTVSAKSNKHTRKVQAAESLMEDLNEMVGSGNRNYTLLGSVNTTTPTPGITVNEISGVTKGFNTFNVKITENTNPTKYSAGGLNNYEVFSFGGEGSNAVMVNACDPEMAIVEEAAWTYYSTIHKQVIDEENALLELGVTPTPVVTPGVTPAATPTPVPITPGVTPTQKTCKDETTIKSKISRELHITTKTDGSYIKMYVHAVYTLHGNEIEFSSDESKRVLSILVYETETNRYNDPNSATTDLLDQIYLLYSPSMFTYEDVLSSCDIRIFDTASVLKSSMYIVPQREAKKTTVGSADAKLYDGTALESRVGTNKTRISYTNDDGTLVSPKELKVYCPEEIIIRGSEPATTSATHYGKKLIGGSAEARVVEITIEVIDPDTGAVLLSGTEVYLQ